MAESNQNISIKIGADLTEFQKAIKSANSAIKDAKNGFELAKASMGNFAKSYDDATTLIEKQGKVVEANGSKVQALKNSLESIRSAMSKYNDAIQEQVKAGNENSKYTEKLKTELEGLEKKYNATNKQLVTATIQFEKSKNTLKEYTDVQKQFKENEEKSVTALGQLNTKITENKDKLAQAKTEYQNIVLSQGKMSKEAKEARDKIKELSSELNTNQKELKESADAADKFDESLKIDTSSLKVSLDYFKQGIYDIAKSMAGALTRTISSQIQDTFTTGINFETAFTGVKKVVNGTEEDFANLKKEIRDMAQEKPISADALASIFQMGAQLGIAKEDLKSFSDTVIDLKNTSDLTEEAGATMIAQYANVKKLPAEDYRKFASTLSYLGSTTATTESRIMETAQRLSGTAAVLKMADKDVLALSTSMSSVGLAAEMGGSAMSKVMMQIEKEVASNGENLKTWAQVAGMSTSEFSKLWKNDVLGAVQKVMKGLSDSSKGGESLVMILDELGISNIRTTQTMMQLSSASELLSDCVDKANNEWEKSTFLTDSASEVYKTTASQMQLLSNAFDEIKISVFESLQEPMLTAMEKIKKALQDPAVKSAITNFAKKFGDVALQVIKNSDKIITVVKTVGTAIAAAFVIGKITAFTSALLNMTNPIGIVINAIALLTGAITTLYVATDGFTTAEGRELKALQETSKELENNKNQILSNKSAREESCRQIDSEYNSYEKLVSELKTLVDENGNVKKGYEDRVNAIIPLLSNATGTEIKLINNQIVGYNNLIKTLDQVIAKKRAEAKLSAYEDDYKNALKNQEEYADKVEEIDKELADKKARLSKSNVAGSLKEASDANSLDGQIRELEKQKANILKIQSEDTSTISKYESMLSDYYKEFESKASESSANITPEIDTSTQDQVVEQMSNTYYKASQAASKATKEESKTTYQELLNQEKEYKTQLGNYLTEMKKGNNDITVEMVEDTKKNLDAVQKKITEIKTLMGDNTVSPKVVLEDESFAGLTAKEIQLKNQVATMQKELAKGNTDITTDMINNVNKQIDQVSAKIKNLKQEWNESGNDGEISDDFESENTDHKSTGVIFGKGVLGEEAVEVQGAGKDAAVQYYEAYKAQKQASEEEKLAQIPVDINTESLAHQAAILDPANLEIHNSTQRIVAENEQIAHAQGLTDNQFRVIDAEIQTLNAAKAEAYKIDFKCIGMYICMGIAQGISENTYMIVDAVRAAMEAAQEEAEEDNEIESPSKVYWRYGRFIDLGLANGIRDNANAINSEMKDVSSGLQNQLNGINSNGATIGGTGKAMGGNVIQYNFNQTNQSNKSLDTLAVYNETKSLLKRVVRDNYV